MDKLLEDHSISYMFGGLSIGFGLHLIVNPFIFTVDYYRPIEIVNSLFFGNWIPWLLVIWGILKIIGAYKDYKKVRLAALVSLSVLWIFFTIVFLFSYLESPNANLFLSVSQVFLAYKIAQRSKFN